MVKHKFYFFIFFLILVIAYLVYRVSLKSHEAEGKSIVFMKSGASSYSKSEFLNYYNYLKLYNTDSLNDSELKKVAINHLIYASKILDIKASDSLIKLDYPKNVDYKKFINDKAIFLAKLKYFGINNLTNSQIKKVYERNGFICIIDEVLIPPEKESQLEKVYEELKNGADAATIQRGKFGVTAIRRSIEIGYLPWDLESIVYEMKIGDIKKIKTKSGHYIIKLLQKIKSIHYNDSFDPELVKKAYITNFIDKKSENWVVNNITNNKNIDFNIISNIDFSSRPLPIEYGKMNDKSKTKDKIVVFFNKNKYTLNDLVYKINKLPEGIQLFFYNSQTRLQATKALLYKERGYKVSTTSNAYLENSKSSILIEKMITISIDSIKKFSSNNINQDQIVNELFGLILGSKNISSIQNISDVLLDKANKLQLQNSIQTELLKVMKSTYYSNIKEIEESQSYLWLYPEAYNKNDSFFIDQKLLYSLSLANDLGKKSIAFSKDWNFTIENLFNELRQLTKRTCSEIQNQKQLLELIIYVAEKNGIKKQDLTIDKSFLPFILPIIKYISIPQIPPDDAQIACRIDTNQFTFGDLKNKWIDLNIDQANRFLTEEQIIKIIEDLYWLKYGDKLTANQNLKCIAVWKAFNEMNIDYNKYCFSDLTLKTIFNIVQEKFQKEKTLQSLSKTKKK